LKIQPIPLLSGQKHIGFGHPVFIVAEVGINHNGDMDLACRMIDAAKEAGADSVKFQNYRTADFLGDKSLNFTYESQGKEITESQFDMFSRYELSREQLFLLSNYCKKVNIHFFSTPTGKETLDDLIATNCDLLKNGSDFLVNHRLIRQMAQSGLPTVLSTGMSTLSEIDEAVQVFKEAGGQDLILLHCTSSYPTPPNQVNLARIKTLSDAFGTHVGFSDHSWGISAAIGSVAYGTCFIEKHFTTDKGLAGPDHRFSSDPEEFSQLVKGVRSMEQNIGKPEIVPTESEVYGRSNFRLSCVAARDLPSDHVITEDDINFHRPSSGIHPRFYPMLIGKKTSTSMKEGEQFNFNHLNQN
jgi:N-acetylneuraminate synthase/N,N'-diacetyllegionaminate synthase